MNRSTTGLVTGAAETKRRILSLRDAARITGPSTGHLHGETGRAETGTNTQRIRNGTKNHRET